MKKEKIDENEYIDLGLPSGTLWNKCNEKGYYIYNETLPTQEQFEELKNECTWEWQGDGYKVTGPNGNSIILPAAGIRYGSGGFGHVGSIGSCWSSTPNGSEPAWYLDFISDDVNMNFSGRNYGLSVRLVSKSK